MMKYCFCDKPIPHNARLCKEHLTEYGTDPKKWPDYIKFLVSETQREWNENMRSPEVDWSDIEWTERDPRHTMLVKVDENGCEILRGCNDNGE